MKQERLAHEFVEHIPEQLRGGVIYISMTYATAAHKCCMRLWLAAKASFPVQTFDFAVSGVTSISADLRSPSPHPSRSPSRVCNCLR